jgi:hypothetical protein
MSLHVVTYRYMSFHINLRGVEAAEAGCYMSLRIDLRGVEAAEAEVGPELGVAHSHLEQPPVEAQRELWYVTVYRSQYVTVCDSVSSYVTVCHRMSQCVIVCQSRRWKRSTSCGARDGTTVGGAPP